MYLSVIMLMFHNGGFIVSLDTRELYIYSSMTVKVNQVTLRPKSDQVSNRYANQLVTGVN